MGFRRGALDDEKRTLQYDPVFAASAETSNSRRATRRLRSEDKLVLLICLTKRFRFFVNTANIGGFWYTWIERLRKKENSYVDIVRHWYYIENGTLFMMLRREGYKKDCNALEKWILWHFLSIVACKNISIVAFN